MSINKQSFTGKKRNHPEDISDNDYLKSEETRNIYNENHDRRNYPKKSLNLAQNQPTKRYENIEDQKIIQNNNNYYKKSNYQNASVKTKPDDNYSVSPSRSPSIRESDYAISAGLSDDNDVDNSSNKRKYQQNEPESVTIGFSSNIQYASLKEGVNRHQPQKKDMPENPTKGRDSRNFTDKSFNRDNQQRYSRNYGSIDHYGHSRYDYENNQGDDGKYYNRSSNRNKNNEYSPKNINRLNRGKNEGNKEGFNDYNRKSDAYHNPKSSYHHNQQDPFDRERERSYNQQNNKYRY